MKAIYVGIVLAAFTLGGMLGAHTTAEYRHESALVLQKCLPHGKRHKWSEEAIDASINGIKGDVPERRLP